MKIPKRFMLGGREWTVKRGVKMKNLYGSCSGSRCEIKLSTKNQTRTEELHTFCHELLHAICYTMGWKRLNKNESKIDAMASLLLQAITSMNR